MATLSTVAVDFIANTAKYIQGLTQINNETKKFANQADKQFDKVTKSSNKLGGNFSQLSRGLTQLKAIAGASAFAAFGKEILDTAEKIGDLSDQLNISGEDLQRLQGIFAKSGASLDDVATSISKLEKSAIDASEGNKSLEDSFSRLGINITSFNRLAPEQKIEQFSKALQTIKDPSERAALAQEILGKSSRKVLQGFKDIAEAGDLKKASQDIFTFSDESGRAVSEFADNAKVGLTNVINLAVELAGRFLIANQELKKLQDAKGPAGISTTAGAFFGQGGFGTTSNIAAAIEQARGAFEKTDLQSAREEQALLRERAKQDRERAAALELQAEAFRKVRDSILANIDPVAKYSSEVDKINEIVKKNKLSEEDRLKLIAGISQAYIFAVDPIKKYAAEIAKIKADKGLSEKEKADNIKLLGAAYDDIIDPANKYKKILEDLDALVANEIRTNEERRKVIDNLGSSYRAVYDPAEKFLKVVEELNALPAGSNVDKVKYLQSLGDSYRNIIDPLFEYKKQLKEIEELNKKRDIVIFTFSTGTKIIEQVQALDDAQAQAARNILESQKNIDLAKQKSLLLDDKRLIAQTEYEQTLFNIDRLFAGQAQTQEVLAQKLEMQRIASAKLYSETSPYFKELAQFGENFASGLAMAISEGQNFSSAFSDVFKSVLKQVEVMILRTLILQSIFQAIGLATGGVQSTAATAFAKAVGLRASGGPVSANNPYIVGEKGPEMFVPSSNGVILPNDFQGGGETVIVNQNINVSAGVAQTVRAEMIGLLPRFKQEAMMGVIDAKQRGGSYARSLAS